MLLEMFFGFLITDLPSLVVNLQSAVCVSLCYYNNKSDVYVKEVFRLYIIPRLTFTP